MATFTNQATLSYNNTTTTSNIVTGTIVEVLSATKTALTDTYRAGDTVTYVVSILNSGAVPYSGLTVTDDLGEYTFNTETLVPLTYVTGSVHYFNDGVLQTTPSVTAVSPLTITGIDVPAAGNTLIIYQARVNEFAPVDTDGTITNTVRITSTETAVTTDDNCICNPAVDLTASTTISSEDAVLLSIAKSISPSVVAENGRITYTFTIQNTGNTAAATTDNVTITDTFDPVLKGITVTLNNTVLTETTQYTYNETTGLFQTVAGLITVPAATYTQDATTGQWTVNPGTTTLTVTGTL